VITMDTAELRKNFEEQLANTDKQIAELEANLAKAREYKLKLSGGVETLDLLNPPEEKEETTTEETTAEEPAAACETGSPGIEPGAAA